jgi:diadenosine tetraphosphate (Ap4A) HIT family hydrolase
MCKRHHLTRDEQALFFGDLVLASQALEQVFRPDKMNLQMLGNAVPHLHAHLVRRYHGDPAPGRPIDPLADIVILFESEYEERVEQIRQALTAFH